MSNGIKIICIDELVASLECSSSIQFAFILQVKKEKRKTV